MSNTPKLNQNAYASMSDAYQHALLNGDMAFCEESEKVSDVMMELVNRLVEEGKLPADDNEYGFLSEHYQMLFESRAKKDARFAQLVDLSKFRFKLKLEP